ncbi:hypothetical protein CQW23_34727 [Capsicum baccatum]|uniref:Uncharacterized protein n=1 Tax=Capsicum baccatum TaxID=33114 RepID=A0A2G2UY39_CAPBA|nr:hypothetical protein CQW23_34727 [Capsicum baccatum]
MMTVKARRQRKSLGVKLKQSLKLNWRDTLNDSSNNGALQASSSTNYDDCQSQKTEEESRSKIEAELEAELERNNFEDVVAKKQKVLGKFQEIINVASYAPLPPSDGLVKKISKLAAMGKEKKFA